MKQWYQSRTVWYNLLTVIVVSATFLGYTPNQDLADTVSSLLVAISPIVNIVLRLVTQSGIALK